MRRGRRCRTGSRRRARCRRSRESPSCSNVCSLGTFAARARAGRARASNARQHRPARSRVAGRGRSVGARAHRMGASAGRGSNTRSIGHIASAAAARVGCQPSPTAAAIAAPMTPVSRCAVRTMGTFITSALIWHQAFDRAPPPATRTSDSVSPATAATARAKDVAHRHGHAFQHRPQEIVGVVPARQALERAADIGTPERRPLAGEIRQEQRPIVRRATSRRHARRPPRACRERGTFWWHHIALSAPACVGPPICCTSSPQRSETRPGATTRARRDQPGHFRRARDVVALAGAYRARAHRRCPRVHRAGEHRNAGEAVERRLPIRHRAEHLPRRDPARREQGAAALEPIRQRRSRRVQVVEARIGHAVGRDVRR